MPFRGFNRKRPSGSVSVYRFKSSPVPLSPTGEGASDACRLQRRQVSGGPDKTGVARNGNRELCFFSVFQYAFGQTVVFAFLLPVVFSLLSCGGGAQTVFNASNSAVPLTESILYNITLTWRPSDSAAVSLNPPRFSWPYEPTILPEDAAGALRLLPLRTFSFQIARDRDFREVLFQIERTPYNFYNALPLLPEGRKLYWRVGYHDPEDQSVVEWHRTRWFTITPGATAWDRSSLVSPRFVSQSHPRIIYTADRMESLRALKDRDSHSRTIHEEITAQADRDLRADWFRDFPSADIAPDSALRVRYKDLPEHLDPDGGDPVYLSIITRLTEMAFAWVLTGEDKYKAVMDRMLTVAAWPRGGQSSPSGAGGSEDYGAVTEFLSLFYDWFYHELSEAQREVVLESLRWRTDAIVNNFSWRSRDGSAMSAGSIALAGGSHQFENFNTTSPAGLVAWDRDSLFNITWELAVNYFSGVNNPFGPEDSWNEGPGYGLSKFKWQAYALCYYDMSLENAGFGRNPFLTTIGEFFTRVAVLGLPHLSFGNIGIMEPYYLNNRLSSFRKLAYMTGDRRFLGSWEDAQTRLEQIGYTTHRRYSRPWIEYALPAVYPEPQEAPVEPPRAMLFPDGGWVTMSNLYPGELANYGNNLGIVFHARPRGAFNHSFFGDNGFQIYAYGENITHAGGSTQNGDRHAHHSMAQNVVLVDGMGQAQPNHARMNNFRKELYHPYAARIARFAERNGTVYFKGEAARSYVQYPYVYNEFWGELGDGMVNPYRNRDLSFVTRADRHVLFVDGRYFVMLDDMEVDPERKEGGCRFSWLYHVLQDVPLDWNPDRRRFVYTVGEVTTIVEHVGRATPLNFENRRSEMGLINPITGEDYNPWVRPIRLYNRFHEGPYPEKVTHNIWLTNSEPSRSMRFLVVIYPFRAGSEPPIIDPVDELTVTVSHDGKTETITFDPRAHPRADIKVDLSGN